MKIVFMGTPRFAVPSLEKLAEAGHEICLVVTQPDRKGNRGKVTFSPVKECAIALGLPVAQPERIREDEDFMAHLETLAPDFIVVAAFGQILPERVLNIPKYDCINVHGSLLPKLRGAAPMQYAILQGDRRTGVTIMKMAKGLDTGDMISWREMNIDGMNIDELTSKLAVLGADLLVETISEIAAGKATYTPQDDSESSYAHRILKSDGLTDFGKSAEEEERKIRAFDPWPALYSYLDGKQIKFFRAEVLNDHEKHEPGVISAIDKNSFTVDCGEGRLRILEVQLQGKKRMNAGDFLRGTRVTKGSRLTKGE